MNKILTGNRWLLFKKGFTLIAVLAMLIFAIVVVAPNLSFGWFAKNQTVTANGMHVQAYHSKFKVYYALAQFDENGDKVLDENGNTVYGEFIEADGVLPLFDRLSAPGDTTEFKIKIESIGKVPVLLNGFGLESPNSTEEMARVLDTDGDGNAEAHFLSTEIKTRLLSVEDTSLESEYVFLREENTSEMPERIDYFDQMTDDDGILLNQGDTVTFTVEMAFHNRPDVSQNQFKNFDDFGECSRRLFFTYNEQ